jgi:signal transduction histidine kinase
MLDPRSSQRQPLFRRLLLWLLSFVLIMLTGVSISRVTSLKQQLYERAAKQSELELSNIVATWEAQVMAQVEVWLEAANPEHSKSSALQTQLRRRRPWLDSLYVWVPQTITEVQGRRSVTEAYFLFPQRPTLENREAILRRPCITVSRALTMNPLVSTSDLARSYLHGCRLEAVGVRLVAASEAATVLARAQRYQEALAALDAIGVPDSPQLRRGIRDGLSPLRLTIHYAQRANLLQSLGKTEEALETLNRLGKEITALDAPDSEDLLQFVSWPILAQLEENARLEQTYRLQLGLGVAQRRVRAFHEIAERILPSTPPPQPYDSPRMIYDQYNEPPFIIFYQYVTGENTFGAAVQLEQQELLGDFMERLGALSPYAVIEDSDGRLVMGQGGTDEVTISVPFPRTLSYLRVGLLNSVIDRKLEGLSDQWLTPLVITLLCMIIGFAALSAQTRANSQQQQFVARQREFTTRVTHELKTPLAGIRLMAENLMEGSFKDAAQAQDMAKRIVNESDRLTDRVEEILALSKSRTIPKPKRLDPEEPVMDAIMHWSPRMEANSVDFSADLELTGEVFGDVLSLRDAIACLLDNAIKYRREDISDSRVLLRLYEDEHMVIIEVSDNGIGVPADQREIIFDRFARVEGPNRGRSGGHGLGLAQVEEIVRAHNGQVQCSDGIDGGSCFTIRLPKVSSTS